MKKPVKPISSKKLKINKGDTVEVVAGADKGKKGAVLAINSKKLKITVQGVRMQTNFSKEEGIQLTEGAIDYSNVKLVSAKAKTTAKKASKVDPVIIIRGK